MMVDVITNQEVKKKFAWFVVLMLWIGMVTAVVVHQSQVEEDHITKMSASEGQIKSNEKEQSENVELNTKEQDENAKSVSNKSQVFNLAKKDKETKEESNFFVEYRIERDQSRSEQINLLREMINNPNSGKDAKNKAQDKLLAITNNLEEEMEIESLIQARGYEDGIAFIHNNSVEVIIAAE
ncbi:MAG: SpoIIIAH-like family protein, partial [Halanaerobacter sp.]